MKKLLVGLAAAVVAIITAAIIIPFVIPGEAYKDRLIALVEHATGPDTDRRSP